ncbi:MAG: ABC transporter permease [Limosilactobacillus coleohominis]|uniref:ABC transporter permease n=1 Tax=Limosilactobacillus coleohominis TaxID=181675 RepID=UPI002A8116DC|nr:ABC transporter permease [Limosilactobacillus coleohominis]MCI5812980.1 ABC transporter permease [Lactobacillus sp.]MDY3702939.1 ABC transporter permease [Limosilactobacillus coleohominis]MDY5629177.1 ABC transporter permease [Limosilactobacillus coleohominis]
MFLAIREIRHNKLRYGLIIGMIALIGYLIFMLMGLMLGLANENTAAIKSWDTQTVYLNKNANENLSQSLVSKSQVGQLGSHEALVGTTPVVIKKTTGHASKQSIQFMGLSKKQYLYQKKLELVAGRKPRNNNEIILDESLKDKGYHIGNTVILNSQGKSLKVVGFVKNAKLNISPLAIGSLSTWQQLKGTNGQYNASGIFSDQKTSHHHPQLAKYSVHEFIQKLPGYSAQNTTFEFMIGFLMIISLIVIAVFLYILTMQKLPEYAVLRAQGIPVSTLTGATFAQAMLLMIIGVVISLMVTLITTLLIPQAVPMLISWPVTILVGISLIVLGAIGALLPVHIITKINPLDAI